MQTQFLIPSNRSIVLQSNSRTGNQDLKQDRRIFVNPAKLNALPWLVSE